MRYSSDENTQNLNKNPSKAKTMFQQAEKELFKY
jgi:hypothetical protein